MRCWDISRKIRTYRSPADILACACRGELEDLQGKIRVTAAKLRESVDISKLLQIAEEAEPLGAERIERTSQTKKKERSEETAEEQDPDSVENDRVKCPRIAVARDEAFCFYYEENLRLLEQTGAELVYFSPLHDKALPENIHGMLLGGGYPELYAGQLSENNTMRKAIRAAVIGGLPTVAECGGFLYLHTSLTDREGHSCLMAGVLPEKCFDTGSLVRFGYIELEENSEYFLPRGSRIRAHEFHYYDSEDNGVDCTATKPTIGRNYPCIHVGENHWYGFPTSIILPAPSSQSNLWKRLRSTKIVLNSRIFGGICKNCARKIKNTCIVHRCTVYKEMGKYFG